MYTFQWLCTLLVLSGASVLATQLGDSSDLVLRDGIGLRADGSSALAAGRLPPAPTNLRLRPWRLPSPVVSEKMIGSQDHGNTDRLVQPARYHAADLESPGSVVEADQLENHHDASYHRSRVHLAKRGQEDQDDGLSDRERIRSIRSAAVGGRESAMVSRLRPTATELITAGASGATALVTQSDEVISTGLLTAPSRSQGQTQEALANAESADRSSLASKEEGGWTSTVVVLATGTTEDISSVPLDSPASTAPTQSLTLQQTTNDVGRLGLRSAGVTCIVATMVALVSLIQ